MAQLLVRSRVVWAFRLFCGRYWPQQQVLLARLWSPGAICRHVAEQLFKAAGNWHNLCFRALGQIIPPSIVLIILADQLASAADQAASERKSLYKEATGEFSMPSTLDIVSTSAGDMFLGAFIPGLILVGLYMAYILVSALLRPGTAPAVPYDGKLLERAFIQKVVLSLVPPLVLIFVVLGSIIAGIATVNQAGAIGAIGATIMAGYRLREGEKDAYYPAILAVISMVAIGILTSIFSPMFVRLKQAWIRLGLPLALVAVIAFVASVVWSGWRTFKIEETLNGVMLESAKTTSMVFIILLGAAMLTAAFRGFGGEEIVKEFLTGLPAVSGHSLLLLWW